MNTPTIDRLHAVAACCESEDDYCFNRLRSYLRENPASANDVCRSYPHIVRAASSGSLRSLELLIDYGADVNRKISVNEHSSFPGRSALAMALAQGHYDCADLLIRHGAEIDVLDGQAKAVAHTAAEFLDSDALRFLMLNKGDPNLPGPAGATPMHIAASVVLSDGGGAWGRCKDVLLEWGADPFRLDMDGLSALHWASDTGSVHAVRDLLHLGLNPLLKAKSGATPIDYASLSDSPTAQECLALLEDAVLRERDAPELARRSRKLI